MASTGTGMTSGGMAMAKAPLPPASGRGQGNGGADSEGDVEEYLCGYHYTLEPTNPGYQLQRDQRLRTRLYVEVINILEERETIGKALERLRLRVAVATSAAHNSKKDENSSSSLAQGNGNGRRADSKSRAKKAKAKKELVRLEDLVQRLQRFEGNEDLLISDFRMLAEKVTALKNMTEQ